MGSGPPAPDPAAWEEALTSAREWSSVTFDSVSLTDAQIKALLRAAPKTPEDRFKLHVQGTNVHFVDRIWFGNTELTLQLTGCVFEDEINLTPVFSNTWLDDVRFRRAPHFSRTPTSRARPRSARSASRAGPLRPGRASTDPSRSRA